MKYSGEKKTNAGNQLYINRFILRYIDNDDKQCSFFKIYTINIHTFVIILTNQSTDIIYPYPLTFPVYHPASLAAFAAAKRAPTIP